MKSYICEVCGYVYEEEMGDDTQDVAKGTTFEELSDEWLCPTCGVDKTNFSEA